jgi:hypothetical protein
MVQLWLLRPIKSPQKRPHVSYLISKIIKTSNLPQLPIKIKRTFSAYPQNINIPT